MSENRYEKISANKIILNSAKEKKIKNIKFYDIDNGTNTFQKIITKYHNKKRYYQKQPKNVLAFIEKAKFKAEKLETYKEYMMKELKNDIKLEKELLDLFGCRAKKHYNELNNKKFQSKMNKFDFFTPKEIKILKDMKKFNNKKLENKSKKKYELTHIIFKGRNFNFSPTIMAKNRSNFFNSYSKELKSNNTSSTDSTKLKFKNFNKTSINIKKDRNYKPYHTFDGKDNYIKIEENNKSNYNKINRNKTYLNTETKKFRDKGRIISDKNLSLTLTLNSKKTNNESQLNRINYLGELIKMNKLFLKKEKGIENHFRNNDYGCGYSKMEYRFLTNKFFN